METLRYAAALLLVLLVAACMAHPEPDADSSGAAREPGAGA
ncbi:MAG: hypothetical protein PVF54_08555 [Anaerolineae bacterium]